MQLFGRCLKVYLVGCFAVDVVVYATWDDELATDEVVLVPIVPVAGEDLSLKRRHHQAIAHPIRVFATRQLSIFFSFYFLIL